MRIFGFITTLLAGIVISAIAGYVSIFGMMILFAGHALIVGLLIGSIEFGKLVAASWLKFNWTNPKVSIVHKAYLLSAVIVTSLITSIGLYGFLSAAHLEQKSPLQGLEVKTEQLDVKLAQKTSENKRLEDRLNQIDKNIAVFLNNEQATKGLAASDRLKSERDKLQVQIDANNQTINELNDKLVPLKMQSGEVEAKLGPVKYIAALFGWTDTEYAVRLIIIIIMFVFDPLAVVLLLSAMSTFKEIQDNKNLDKEVAHIIEDLTPAVLPEPVNDAVETIETIEEIIPEQTNRERIIDLIEKEPEFINEILSVAKELEEKDTKKGWLDSDKNDA